MNEVIKYKNNQGEFISYEQAINSSNYSTLYYVGDELKREEEIFNHKPFAGLYYLSSDEDPITIIPKLNKNYQWDFLTKSIENGYTVYTGKGYDDDFQLKSKYYKEVYNSRGEQIATVTLDSKTHNPKGAFKIFRFGDDDDISFSFDDKGYLEDITISEMILSNELHYTNLNSFLRDIEEFIGDFITQEELGYYTNPNAIVPTF